MSASGIINCGFAPGCGSCRRCRELSRCLATALRCQRLAVRPQHLMPSFSLHTPPRRCGVDDSARARNVDAIVEWAWQAR